MTNTPAPLEVPKKFMKRVHLRRDRPTAAVRSVSLDPFVGEIPDDPEVAQHRVRSGLVDHWYAQGVDVAIEHVVSLAASRQMRRGLPKRLRELLACADDGTYFDAVSALDSVRHTHEMAPVICAYLVPTETDWFRELDRPSTRDGASWWMMAVSNVDDVAFIANDLRWLENIKDYAATPADEIVATLIEGVGIGFVPHLHRWLEGYIGNAKLEAALVDVAMGLETEASWRAVLSRVHVGYQVPASRREAFKKGFAQNPELAARVFLYRLGASDHFATQHAYLAEQLLADHPDAVRAVHADLDPTTAALVESLDQELEEGAEATVQGRALPPILANPPWENRNKQPKRPTVADVEMIDVEPYMRWAEGEQQRWLETIPGWRQEIDVSQWAELRSHERRHLLKTADPDAVRHLLGEFEGSLNRYDRGLVARFELDLMPLVIDLLHAKKQSWELPAYALLLPYGTAEVAVAMIELYGRRIKASSYAVDWMRRHPDLSATYLIPRVASPVRKGRSVADAALRLIARSDEDVVRTVAAEYGEAVDACIAAFLSIDPLDVLPPRTPGIPSYLSPRLLEAPSLVGSQQALPHTAVENILIMLALSKESEYPGLELVSEACEPDSLARFALSVYRAWFDAGRARKDVWSADAIDFFGNDSIVEAVTGVIDKTVRVADEVRQAQVDMLDRIGTEAAMHQLFRLSQVIPRKVTAADAQKRVNEMAEVRGLTPDQLADRLIPSFDLDARGSMRLDFGSRFFTVAFDEELTPIVRADDGSLRKSLPKAGVGDDGVKAAAAHKEFKKLKREVKATARDQRGRFEQAMVTGRRWTAAEFRTYFVDHPLMVHLVRRLVWGAFVVADEDPIGTLTRGFRMAEDGTFADRDDEVIGIGDDLAVGVVHPLELGDDVVVWAERFADYEILQPFEQLGRMTFAPQDWPAHIDPAGAEITAVGDPVVPYQRVLGLASRGWQNEQISRSTGHYVRELRRATVSIDTNPGFHLGEKFVDQRLNPIRLPVALGSSDPITVSEVLREITWLTR